MTKNNTKMPESYRAILTEMCDRVGVKYKDIDFKKPDWYLKHEWTKKEEKDFKEWLEKYLLNNKEARQEVMRFPSTNKRSIKSAVDTFISYCGWKTAVQ